MKLYAFALLCLLGVPVHSQSEKQAIRVKGEMKAGKIGYPGGWDLAYFNQQKSESWAASDRKLIGIPRGWDEHHRKEILFQRNQYIFQNYKQGNISDTIFSMLAEKMSIDTVKYSSTPIRCFSTLIYHQKPNGKVEYMVDTDGDGDFSDEKVYKPLKGSAVMRIESTIKKVPVIQYELFVNNILVRDSVPFMAFLNESEKDGMYLAYTFPLYAEGRFGEETFYVTQSKVDFSRFTVMTRSQLNIGENNREWEKSNKGDRVQFLGNWYEVDDFDRASMELVLEKVDRTKDSISPTVGFYAPDFEFEEMISEKTMNLSDLRGKYVLLDFWGTWCKPCVAGIPDLVKLKNDFIDESFEIVSVAVSSDLESFSILQEKHGMNWLHAWQPKQNGVVDEYNIHSYPTFVILDPDGRIIDMGSYHILDSIKQHLLKDSQ